MKKITLTFCLLALGLGVNAQALNNSSNDPRSELRIGFKGGLNYSNVYDTDGEDFKADPRLGFAAGGFLSIPLSTFAAIQPEVMFSQKGYEGTGRFLGMNYSYSRTLSYLDVPIYFSLRPTQHVSFLIGPQYSFLLRQRDEFHSSAYTSIQEEEFENDNIRKNTLGFTTGLDFNFNNAVLGLRVAWDLQDNNGDGTSSVPKYKNTVLQATLGFSF